MACCRDSSNLRMIFELAKKKPRPEPELSGLVVMTATGGDFDMFVVDAVHDAVLAVDTTTPPSAKIPP